MSLGAHEEIRCPDWAGLVAERDLLGDNPPAWRDSLRHFDGCSRCREEALAAEPTLLFRRLPGAAPAATPTRGAEIPVDIEAMQRAVATLRRTRPLQTAPAADESRTLRRRLSAVAATLLFAVLLGSAPGHGPAPAVGEDEMVPSVGAVAGAESLFEAAGFGDGAPSSSPVGSSVEEVDLPNSLAYEFTSDVVTVAVLVNGNLDV